MKRTAINIIITALLVISCASYAGAGADEIQKWIDEGDRLYREGKYDEAAEAYDKASRLAQESYPKNEEPLTNMPGSPAESAPAFKLEQKLAEAFGAFTNRPFEEEKPVEALVDKAAALVKEKKYEDAAAVYEEAYQGYVGIADKASAESGECSARLNDIKGLLEEKKHDKELSPRLKEEYIKLLKKRRAKDLLKQRAGLKAENVLQKKTAAERRIDKIKEAKHYKAVRIREKQRRRAEEEALIEARKRLEEEKSAAKETGPKKAGETEAGIIIKEAKSVTEKEIRRRRELAKSVEPAQKKEGRDIDLAGPFKGLFAKAEKKEKAEIEEAEKKETKPEEKAPAEEISKSEKIGLREEEMQKKRELLAAKEEEKRLLGEKIKQEKESFMRQRLGRIEEAMFEKRQEKLDKKMEALKVAAMGKAGRTKGELDRYALSPNADQRRLKKAGELVSKGDSYFEKGMYKEAGKLYDRALLTVRGKLY